MPNLREQLRCCLEGRVCLMGIGNVDYGDDGFGVRLAEKLIEAGTPDVVVGGTSPDRCLGRVVEEGFNHLVFLDAVECGGTPGSAPQITSANVPPIAAAPAALKELRVRTAPLGIPVVPPVN